MENADEKAALIAAARRIGRPGWLRCGRVWAARRSDRAARPGERGALERGLRWFLLVWLALIYGRELLYMYGLDVPKKLYVLTQCLPFADQPRVCPPDVVSSFLEVRPLALLLFTVLVVLQAVFLWAGLAGAVPRRFHGIYFLEQTLLFVLVSVIANQAYVVLSLYLALILAAIGILKEAGPVLRVALLYGLPFLYFYFVYASGQDSPSASHSGLFGSADYLVLPLFVIGYLALYTQQLRAQARLVAYARRVEELTLAAERQRMARELHDTLAQSLVGLTLQLETVDALLGDAQAAQAQAIVRQVMRRARGTLREARAAIDDLRAAPGGAQPFLAGVHAEIERFSASTGIACRAELDALAGLPESYQAPLLRIVGEGLSNIARHAHARDAWVRSQAAPGWITLEIGDEGRGFAVGVASPERRYGLRGLQERVALCGGRLAIQSAPGAGTILRFAFPSSGAGPSSNAAAVDRQTAGRTLDTASGPAAARADG